MDDWNTSLYCGTCKHCLLITNRSYAVNPYMLFYCTKYRYYTDVYASIALLMRSEQCLKEKGKEEI